MVQLIQVGDSANIPRREYVVDTTAEMNSLPKEFATFVLNLDDDDLGIYVCNGSGTFVKITK